MRSTGPCNCHARNRQGGKFPRRIPGSFLGNQTNRHRFGPQATLRSTFSLLEWSLQPHVEEVWKELAEKHSLVLNPFDDSYRARIFAFADSAVIGDAPMTTSIRKAREFGFFGTVDSYHSIFDTLHDMARLKLIPAPVVKDFAA